MILFHVVDKSKELDFNFEDRPYKFIDLESGAQIRLHPAKMKGHYVDLVNRFKNELRIRCGQYHIDMIEADINAGFEQVLLPYLVKRSKLF